MARSVPTSTATTCTTAWSTTVNVPPDRRQRHLDYLRALEEHSQIRPIKGFFQQKSSKCAKGGKRSKRPVEKQTDVAPATHLLVDAYEGRIQQAFVLSADADLVPAVQAVRHIGMEVVVWSPPRRKSDELVAAADAHLHFTRADLSRSQLPNPVSTKKGKELWRPDSWV
jgi:uncharacterized LabA/DUF88 family protein